MKETFKPSEHRSVDLFFTFLKRNQAYDSYIRKLSNSDSLHGIVDFNRLSPEDYISNAFFWASTPEGLNYWKFLNYKWSLVVDLFNL